jgi:hypothetical protein
MRCSRHVASSFSVKYLGTTLADVYYIIVSLLSHAQIVGERGDLLQVEISLAWLPGHGEFTPR